jgi:glutamate/tyrosine decarboxylase-like PLP-dependent enzyme
MMRKLLDRGMKKISPRFLSWTFRRLRSIPPVEKKVQKEYTKILKDLETVVKPYKEQFPTFSRLPRKGLQREQVIKDMQALSAMETARWKDGFASGAVYHGNAEHIEFLNKVYALHSQSNPLHSDLWPSIAKYESEIVSMTAGMLGGGAGEAAREVCGVVSSGGTESILLAMKTYRDRARDRKRITRPEMVVPVTAHAAFDKAARYFNIKTIHIPVDESFRADVAEARKALSRNTIVVVGSAPSFPHGVIDPIQELSEMAHERKIGFHTDACLGGFVLPWAEKLGYPVPPFDFRLPGVTSLSADTHKYGYAAKGTSVILYRDARLRRYQYFKATDWPGGLYFSPTFAGSRPGALIATCRAAMLAMGAEGYLRSTQRILETAAVIKKGIQALPDLHILGDPLWVIAFASKTLDIYRIMEYMTQRRWSLNGLHLPPCVHICVTLRHTRPGVAERFVSDLDAAVSHVREHPAEKGAMAPVYGLAARIPVRGIVGDLIEKYMDMLYKV